MSNPEFLSVGGISIAVRRIAGFNPGVVWLGGYRSDMLGTKAETLVGLGSRRAAAPSCGTTIPAMANRAANFADGTISTWLAESQAVFDAFSSGPQILVGSSMGAWIALRMAQELRKAGQGERVAGMVLLAPAPDFTAELIEPALSDRHRRDLERQGYFEEPSEYSPEPNVYTRALIEDGRQNRVMTGPIDTHCPVHVIQGMADPDVPHEHALKLVSLLPADDVTLSLVPDGDHRLSRPQDLDLMVRAVESVIAQAA